MAFAFVAICQRFECSPKAMELAAQSAKSIDFIADLRSENLGQDAVQALSRMMPKEQAVDWAEQSARMAGEEGGALTGRGEGFGCCEGMVSQSNRRRSSRRSRSRG